MLESGIQKQILKYLTGLPCVWCYKASDKFIAGIPDIICCVYGSFVAFEVKRPDKASNTHRKFQKYVRSKIKKAEGLAYEVSGLDEVKHIIDFLVFSKNI